MNEEHASGSKADPVNNPTELGGVYRFPLAPNPIRIIGMDEKEVFYDTLWEHNKSWAFAGNLGRRCGFYRAPLKWFSSVAQKIDHLPLSDEEYSVFRPDLPLRFGRNRNASWHEIKSRADEVTRENPSKIFAGSLYLVPYGETGGRRKSVLVKKDSGTGFSEAELILIAAEIRNSVNPKPSKGIGIYRAGIEKRTPSFYIGEYLDEHGYLITLD